MRDRSRRNSRDGGTSAPSGRRNVWDSTASKRFPILNSRLATSTASAKAPAGVSRAASPSPRCRGGGVEAPERGGGALAGQAPGRGAAVGEVQRDRPRRVAALVHHDELVRQVQHQVALGGVPLLGQLDRLELEREVVPERAVEAELQVSHLVAVVPEQMDQGADHRKEGRLWRGPGVTCATCTQEDTHVRWYGF